MKDFDTPGFMTNFVDSGNQLPPEPSSYTPEEVGVLASMVSSPAWGIFESFLTSRANSKLGQALDVPGSMAEQVEIQRAQGVFLELITLSEKFKDGIG